MQTISPLLVAARLELHYAAQVVAACADAWLPERADDGHTAMEWNSPTLVGRHSPAEVTIGVRAIDFAIVATSLNGSASFPLVGKTLSEAMAWADARFGEPRGVAMRDYDMPASPLAIGGRFVGHEPELALLTQWLDVAQTVLTDALAREARKTELLVWPHHFDLGAIVYLDPDDDVRQMGVGLSLGDRYYAEPYFYITPSPLSSKQLPPLAGGGFWRTEEWTGAVLPASVHGNPDEFVASAIAAARALL